VPEDLLVRPCGPDDRRWLLRAGLDPEKIGSQYSWPEAPLQLLIAPWRAAVCARRRAALAEVGGRRAGYIGPNPLSGNLEYFLQPWARGGRGPSLVEGYFRLFPARDVAERFFVSAKNDRSLRALERGLGALGWSEGDGYVVTAARYGRFVVVEPGARPAPT
jgi:hypothetical protein